MLLNYLKLAWRNLLKYRFFTALNITGLSIGVACFLLITLFVTDELSFDRFHDHAGNIYRVDADIVFGGSSLALAVASDPMGEALRKDYPEVQGYTRIYTSNGSKLIKKGNVFINEDDVAHVDSTFFDIFTYPAISGDTRKALTEPNTVVLTESAARKYFGNTDVLGKMLETNDAGGTLYKVTAVIQDMPRNAHFYFDFLFSMKNVQYDFGNYLSHNFSTYLLLRPGTTRKAFEKHFPDYINKYVFPQAAQFMQLKSIDEFEKSGNRISYQLTPLTDIHLRSDRMAEIRVNSNIQYVYIFSAVAIFTLLIACVNFMNLSTARSANRAKEVGIRKVLGSERKTLIRQFLTESGLLAVISLVIAIVLTWVALPFFNSLAGKSFRLTDLVRPDFLLFLVLLPVFIGLMAGLYPAFYLSSFNPITVLKGKLNAGARRSGLRSTLVVFQFATSIILIVGTIVVYRQLNFIQNKKIGFNKDQVLVINGTGALDAQYRAFRNEVEKLPGVLGSTMSGYLPVMPGARSDQTFSKESVMDPRNGFNMQCWRIDENYIPTLGMEMKAGRNFSRAFGTDSSGIIINESTAALLGYADPVGKILYSADGVNSEPGPHTIIGVVKDFHFASLKQKIGPLSFVLGNANWATSFKVKAANVKDILNKVQKIWTGMAPQLPFSYQFLDESFSNMYRAEQRAGKIALVFSVLAILIACLGLFGLASFMAEQRTKEIGVRKVLGASVQDIVGMLSKDFLLLVVISSVVAVPLAWYGMHRWLEDFAYRSALPAWIFVAAAIAALLIALITISFQAIKAALANPVSSLRSE
ncbi:ABC transporter permease [Flavihumibacter petaseus]|uniref:Putative ABC transporter permease protein n=1 Tax=Flavihumibacter petaseus NBRC 106054 TaxID=1220578 RepID=A0A0E9N3J7_9BACT|nr:ABC transporter permease [Flavihumibacter petaseus]GAO44384.1 putative ABC transporter permease protein [Flavihumibacter petaseus NBRC 106054]